MSGQQQLSQQLTQRLGKGFDVTNLRNVRAFYLCFPKRNALRSELSWAHYRTLLRLENPSARNWYLNEAVDHNWSARALERQIGALYYERLRVSPTKSSDDNPTIGLVLCSEKSEAVVKYSVLADQQQLFAAKYLPYLSSEEELKRELERERAEAVSKSCNKGAGHE